MGRNGGEISEKCGWKLKVNGGGFAWLLAVADRLKEKLERGLD